MNAINTPRLSIVVPCFNRHDILCGCLRSISASLRDEVEVVVVDDGSSPPLRPLIAEILRPQDKVLEQANRGRAAALREGLLACSGRYALIMDSDDEFVRDAIDVILRDLHGLDEENLIGLVYPTIDFDSGRSLNRLPSGSRATLLSLRADFGVKGDLKEVVRVEVIRSCLYPDPGSERRVPTSFIWAGVSSMGKVEAKAMPIVRHRYLEGGMTKSISKLKRENPYWLAQTYLRIATAPMYAYRSRSFRFGYLLRLFSFSSATLTDENVRELRRHCGIFSCTIAWVMAVGIRKSESLQACWKDQ